MPRKRDKDTNPLPRLDMSGAQDVEISPGMTANDYVTRESRTMAKWVERARKGDDREAIAECLWLWVSQRQRWGKAHDALESYVLDTVIRIAEGGNLSEAFGIRPGSRRSSPRALFLRDQRLAWAVADYLEENPDLGKRKPRARRAPPEPRIGRMAAAWDAVAKSRHTSYDTVRTAWHKHRDEIRINRPWLFYPVSKVGVKRPPI